MNFGFEDDVGRRTANQARRESGLDPAGRYNVAKKLHINTALTTRNPEAERLAAELVRRTGEMKTEAVTKS